MGLTEEEEEECHRGDEAIEGVAERGSVRVACSSVLKLDRRGAAMMARARVTVGAVMSRRMYAREDDKAIEGLRSANVEGCQAGAAVRAAPCRRGLGSRWSGTPGSRERDGDSLVGVKTGSLSTAFVRFESAISNPATRSSIASRDDYVTMCEINEATEDIEPTTMSIIK